MHSVFALVLLSAATLTFGQDARVCSVVSTDDARLPTLGTDSSAFSAGYEKKTKSSAMDQYTFVESGLHTYAMPYGQIKQREAVKVLRPNSNYKHIVDYYASQVLVLNMADAWQSDGCTVQTFDEFINAEQSITGIIGLSKARTQILGPLGVFFLNTPATKTEEHLYNDMVVDIYTSCYWDEASQLTVSLIWRYLQDPVVPQSAVIQYSIGKGAVQQIAFDFFNVQILSALGISTFELPHFYICKNWAHNKPAVNLTNAFAFDSEVLLKADDQSQPNVILSYSDHLDAQFNVSKRTTTSGQLDGSVTTTSTVFDGTSAIRYTIDDRLGNCTLSIASQDNTDILWAHLLNPADFWKNSAQQFYGGLKMWRGMECETIVYEVTDPVYRVNVRYELYVAISNDLLHLPRDRMPVAQLVGVPPSFQPRITTYQNVFNFDLNTATIANYDVSACYVLESQRHFVMTFTANSGLSESVSDALKDQFIRTTAAVAKFSPVRITMIEAESTDNMYITFTVLQERSIPGALKVQSTTDGIGALYNAVSSGTFKITLVSQTEHIAEITATDLQEISRRTPSNWFRGFSGGDVAALTLSMFFGTMIIAVVLFYFVVTPFYVPTLSGGGGTEVNLSS